MVAPPRVLIIEDEAVIRRAVGRLVERNGIQPSAVESVEQAQADPSLQELRRHNGRPEIAG